jgi:hypothetical protein
MKSSLIGLQSEKAVYDLELTELGVQYNFRMRALAGLVPGVKKASW